MVIRNNYANLNGRRPVRFLVLSGVAVLGHFWDDLIPCHCIVHVIAVIATPDNITLSPVFTFTGREIHEPRELVLLESHHRKSRGVPIVLTTDGATRYRGRQGDKKAISKIVLHS